MATLVESRRVQTPSMPLPLLATFPGFSVT